MLLGGLWHGASWSFVFWGGLHGSYLIVDRLLGRRFGEEVPGEPSAIRLLKIVGTFHLVVFAWVFFRVTDFGDAWTVASRIATGINSGTLSNLKYVLIYGTPLLALDLLQSYAPRVREWISFPWPVRGIAYGCIVVWILALGNVDGEVPFIYFQF